MSGEAGPVPVRRRGLRFDTLADAVRDAEHLLAVGYDRTGKWDLAQCCSHLADWLTFPLDGYPKPPLLLRPVMWAVRNTVGRGILAKALRDGMPEGGPTMPQTVAKPGGEDRTAVERFRAAAARWNDDPGPFHPSPVFGPLTRDEALALQRVHAAHHFGFLVPKG